MSTVVYVIICLIILLVILFANRNAEGFNDAANTDKMIGYVLIGLGILFLPFLIGPLFLAAGVYFLFRS